MNTIHTISGKLVEIKWERIYPTEKFAEVDCHNWDEECEGMDEEGKDYHAFFNICDGEIIRFIEFV
jgi:hypothetical protein